MGFRTNNYAKVWNVESKGKYSVVDLSVSKKNKQTGEYEKDFGSKFVRFIGTAHDLAGSLKKGDSIKLGDIDVTNSYDKETKASYTNFLVYSFEKQDGGNQQGSKPAPSQAKADAFENISDGLDSEELPFE